MEPYLFETMARVEEQHWWFVGRRQLVERTIADLRLGQQPTILEAGCGTGGNLAMLARHGRVLAMESDAAALAHAAAKSTATVTAGALPDRIPFSGTDFDLIVLLDVLEHLADDGAALTALAQRLTPGGRLLITVPAFPWLWSAHDEAHHHHRRYTRHGLTELLTRNGLRVVHAAYFNFLLFPLFAVLRLFNKGGCRDALRIPPQPLNRLLLALLSLERQLGRLLPLPCGSSLLMVASPDHDVTQASSTK